MVAWLEWVLRDKIECHRNHYYFPCSNIVHSTCASVKLSMGATVFIDYENLLTLFI